MAKKNVAKRPIKKTTEELMKAICDALIMDEYYFTDHGDKRSKSRKSW
jgi:hypothetical protein